MSWNQTKTFSSHHVSPKSCERYERALLWKSCRKWRTSSRLSWRRCGSRRWSGSGRWASERWSSSCVSGGKACWTLLLPLLLLLLSHIHWTPLVLYFLSNSQQDKTAPTQHGLETEDRAEERTGRGATLWIIHFVHFSEEDDGGGAGLVFAETSWQRRGLKREIGDSLLPSLCLASHLFCFDFIYFIF